MGNQQPLKAQQDKPQQIKSVQISAQQVPVEEVQFAQQIQYENQRNINKRKSTKPVLQEKFNHQPSVTTQAKVVKKQPSKQELPPLKMKNMKAIQNNDIQTTMITEELEEFKIEKISKTVPVIKRNQPQEYFEDNESEGQKQNNDIAAHLRPKKFRPLQHNGTKKLNFTSISNANELSKAQQIPEINVL